jgi:peptide-methionine (R)-S-oxide reductase
VGPCRAPLDDNAHDNVIRVDLAREAVGITFQAKKSAEQKTTADRTPDMIDRRRFATTSLAALATGAGLATLWFQKSRAASPKTFEITRTEEEWRRLLTPEQFHILRQHGTEPPFSSPLNENYAAGLYHCAGCDLALYSSETKYDSRTGWPSFYAALDNAVATAEDNLLFFTRTEVHCRRCGGHLGHIFPDGPPPTGKRHCINGLAVRFVPKA